MKFNHNRRKLLNKSSVVLTTFSMLLQIVWPNVTMALTSGPSQPEVQTFEPVGTTDMVNLFTGDFTYNIPLLDLPGPNGGYPFNLAYQSGIGMDQEASWVGLGWNLNPGSIMHNVRGLADDYSGGNEKITETVDLKNGHTGGISLNLLEFELFGANALKAAVGLNLYYNNHKGFGYGLNLGLSPNKGHNSGFSGGISLDSQEGIGANVSFDVQSNLNRKDLSSTTTGVGVGFNSKRGLNLSVDHKTNKRVNTNGYIHDKTTGGVSSKISFSETVHSPVVQHATRSVNLNVGLSFGGSNVAFLKQPVMGYYNIEWLKNKNKAVDKEAYGYTHLNKAQQNIQANHKRDYVQDFSRFKDGLVRPESSNLAVPSLDYDVYNVMGQGVGGMFRPYQNEIGQLNEPWSKSWSAGGSFSTEVGGGSTGHGGIDAGGSYGESYSSPWHTNNPWFGNYYFGNSNNNVPKEYEQTYFKIRGEHTTFGMDEMAYIGGEEAVRANLKKTGPGRYQPEANRLDNKADVTVTNTASNYRPFTKKRVARNNSIQSITNKQIIGNTSNEILPEYDINYYLGSLNPNASTQQYNFDRSVNPENHMAGITVLKPTGQRYVYALPAYNREHVEEVFTVDGSGITDCDPTYNLQGSQLGNQYRVPKSDKYHKRTEKPAYPHAYMLTSVLGDDYVDVDKNGPSEDDFGYWVKFDYAKVNDNYRWRAPYYNARFNSGMKSTTKDDKASYMSGTKELWYLATAETKTHIAVFETSEREDARETASEYNPSSVGANSFFQLDKIKLYDKAAYKANPATAIPIQTVHFTYNYSLCPGIKNSSNGGGKLTLEKVHTTYYQNTRGQMSPYVFHYADTDHNSNTPQDANFSYNEFSYDRWGNYKESSGVASCNNQEYPYTLQFEDGVAQTNTAKENFRTQQDLYAAAWQITSIDLPTGGTLEIDYESDDYGYVQHRQATQMFKVKGFHSLGGTNPITTTGEVWNHNAWSNASNTDELRQVHFQLEHPIPVSANNPEQELYNQYLKPMERTVQGEKQVQVFFKSYMQMRDDYWDYVSGYALLDTDGTAYGVGKEETLNLDGNGPQQYYTQGYVILDNYSVIDKDDNHQSKKQDYHPFAMAAWQFMRTTNPDLLTAAGTLSTEAGSSNFDKLLWVKSLFSIGGEALKVFKGFRKHSFDQKYAKNCDLSKTWLRLATPDKIKLGGGSRVKKISLIDGWNLATGENESRRGVVYDYSITVNGKTYSSGVAEYEPMTGGEENALRYAKTYPQHLPLQTNNNLFTELPINEAYYPGANVGYSRVTVKSENTDKVIKGERVGAGTTGVIRHEFYTAKDYPVITEETRIQKKPYKLYVPLIFIGQISMKHMTASQGYAIQLNDMHGKPSKITNFGLDANGQLIEEPINSIAYSYQHDIINYDGAVVRKLNNKVDVLVDDHDEASGQGGLWTAETEERIMGVEYDFFTDQRKSVNWSGQIGLDFNVEQVGPITVPGPWPSVSYYSNKLKTVTTNKIIHKSGILLKTVAKDGQSTIATENKLFDGLTGEALLTTVQNNFDAPIYNYKYPAHWEYASTGSAVNTWGLKFTGIIGALNPTKNWYSLNASGNNLAVLDQLVPGDEFIISNEFTGTYLGLIEGVHTLHSEANLSGVFDLFIHRSGNRNLLMTTIGSVIALADPTKNREEAGRECGKWNYQIPVGANKGGYAYGTGTQQGNVLLIDQVIEASALKLSENWLKDIRDLRFENTDWTTFNTVDNPYQKGELGVWHPQKTYTYLENRKQTPISATDAPVTIATDGSYDDMPLFIWKSPDNMICREQWQKVDEYTAYSPYGYEQETKNLLEQYSSALYGYKGALAIAVGSNTEKNGFGFESFEEYEAIEDNPTASISNLTTSTGNLDLYTVNSNPYDYHKQVEVLSANNNLVELDLPYSSALTALVGQTVRVSAEEIVANVTQTPQKTLNEYQISAVASIGNGNTLLQLNTANAPGFTGNWRGFVGLSKTTAPSSITASEINITNKKAHTGKHSMLLKGTQKFVQNRLDVIANKKYVVSAWVSREKEGVPTYADNILVIRARSLDANGNVLNATYGEPIGNIIEGWQKVEFEFTTAANTTQIELEFESGASKAIYLDDLRLFPANGNMASYVYDPSNFRLSATLDANNYATYYHYDEQGNLFLTTRETTEGVFTIQESRSHIAE